MSGGEYDDAAGRIGTDRTRSGAHERDETIVSVMRVFFSRVVHITTYYITYAYDA